MNSVKDEQTEETLWDFKLKNKALCWIDHDTAEEQRAVVSTFLQRGTVPQAPSIGIQWAELLSGTALPQEVNIQIKNAITEYTGGAKYFPKYSMKDGKLFVEVKKA